MEKQVLFNFDIGAIDSIPKTVLSPIPSKTVVLKDRKLFLPSTPL